MMISFVRPTARDRAIQCHQRNCDETRGEQCGAAYNS